MNDFERHVLDLWQAYLHLYNWNTIISGTVSVSFSGTYISYFFFFSLSFFFPLIKFKISNFNLSLKTCNYNLLTFCCKFHAVYRIFSVSFHRHSFLCITGILFCALISIFFHFSFSVKAWRFVLSVSIFLNWRSIAYLWSQVIHKTFYTHSIQYTYSAHFWLIFMEGCHSV